MLSILGGDTVVVLSHYVMVTSVFCLGCRLSADYVSIRTEDVLRENEYLWTVSKCKCLQANKKENHYLLCEFAIRVWKYCTGLKGYKDSYFSSVLYKTAFEKQILFFWPWNKNTNIYMHKESSRLTGNLSSSLEIKFFSLDRVGITEEVNVLKEHVQRPTAIHQPKYFIWLPQ